MPCACPQPQELPQQPKPRSSSHPFPTATHANRPDGKGFHGQGVLSPSEHRDRDEGQPSLQPYVSLACWLQEGFLGCYLGSRRRGDPQGTPSSHPYTLRQGGLSNNYLTFVWSPSAWERVVALSRADSTLLL